jgi:NAD-dependent dihydropyrimidine dehydrogenase PreA subunit
MQSEVRSMKPVINKRRCPAQKEICKAIPACPAEALTYVVDENELMGGKIVVDESLCNECGICVEKCCGQAIELC